MGNNEHGQTVVDEQEPVEEKATVNKPGDSDTANTGDAETVNGESQATEEAGGDELDKLQQALEASKQEAAGYKDQVLRAQAELQNMQKRASRDIENAHKFALEKFLGDLLPVLDSMELGINASDSSDDVASLREGMDLTLKMFRETMEKAGIVVIDPQGEKFNPEQHEAVTMQESAESASGTVISVMQKGYELNGRLVRPAMVIVAK